MIGKIVYEDDQFQGIFTKRMILSPVNHLKETPRGLLEVYFHVVQSWRLENMLE